MLDFKSLTNGQRQNPVHQAWSRVLRAGSGVISVQPTDKRSHVVLARGRKRAAGELGVIQFAAIGARDASNEKGGGDNPAMMVHGGPLCCSDPGSFEGDP